MLIKTINWNWNSISSRNTNVDFYLERNNWDDHHFSTTYYLHLSSKHTKDKKDSLIGEVKILKKGQKEHQSDLINLGEFESLTDEFCSLGQSLDYYQRIGELNSDLREYILKALNDVIYNPAIKAKFKDEDGYTTSLMRYVNEDSDIFNLAPVILTGDFDSIPDTEALNFKFKTSEMSDYVEFDFTSNTVDDDWNSSFGLSNRVIAIIGKNGSGKTTFLSKLSKLVFASTTDRIEKFNNIAEIEPKGLGFPRIISVSYSAFDTFKVPGIKIKEVEQIAKEINNGQGRYIYCGIRNITEELTSYLDETRTRGTYIKDEDIQSDKYSINILKTTQEINDEFNISLSIIESDETRNGLLSSVIKILAEESSFAEIFNVAIQEINSGFFHKIFNDLSTGHKFILHAIISIIKNIEKNSLVLFDEPEIHLHPPLLSVLMKSLRFILDNRSSYMIVTTHSPVVVQETLSRHVFIIRRVGNKINLFKPDIQTYGENIGLITSHIFGLNSDITSYYDDLNRIVKIYKNDPESLNEKIKNISHLFDDNISVQTRAYLMTKLIEGK